MGIHRPQFLYEGKELGMVLGSRADEEVALVRHDRDGFAIPVEGHTLLYECHEFLL